MASSAAHTKPHGSMARLTPLPELADLKLTWVWLHAV